MQLLLLWKAISTTQSARVRVCALGRGYIEVEIKNIIVSVNCYTERPDSRQR
jgi:hypothetical protein